MAVVGQGNGLFVHHTEGYNKLSLLQQVILKKVTPHVAAATKSLNDDRGNASFTVVDYGAADCLNSVPMIVACAGELSSEVSEFEWMFNDLSDFENTQKVEERLREIPGWKEGSVKLKYVVANFYKQVVQDNSVDLGVSVNAVHWLSQRPPKGCSTDIRYPDETTKAIAAQDWVDFLNCRERELKQDGRLVIGTLSIGDNSPWLATDKDFITIGIQKIIKDMYGEGIITQEECEFALVSPATLRTGADIRAPFNNPKSKLSQNLQLFDMKMYNIPCQFSEKWIKAGGRQNLLATEEYVSALVNHSKSIGNSFWKILEVTRSREAHDAILDTFYKRVEEMVRSNLEGYHTGLSVTVVEIMKL